MRYVKSSRTATVGFEYQKATILATRQKKNFKPEEFTKKDQSYK